MLKSHRFLRYALKRLLFVPFGVFLVVTLTYFMINLVPSDPAAVIAPADASRAEIARINVQLGLNHSVWYRYFHFLRAFFFHLDLGSSWFTTRTVWSDIWLYLPSTVELVVISMFVAMVIGIGVGTIGAYFRRRPAGHLARAYISISQAVPDFFLGLVVIYFLFYKLNWLPAPTGQLGILDTAPPAVTNAALIDALIAGDWGIVGSALAHLVLPVMSLAVVISAFFAKVSRSSLAGALDSHQAEFARACGLPERQVFAYAFRVARASIITYGGILFSSLLGGAAIIEIIFTWNGIGQFAYNRILALDVPEIEGIVLVFGLVTLLVFIITDLLVLALDPRVTYE